MVRENKYLVLKLTDIDEYLSGAEFLSIRNCFDKINKGRTQDAKQPLKYVVVEHDWPEYELTWELIEKRVNSENA